MGFRVGDKYRTNNLSLKPGGSTISVLMADGHILDYDKVKDPWAYMKVLKRENVGQIIKWWIKNE